VVTMRIPDNRERDQSTSKHRRSAAAPTSARFASAENVNYEENYRPTFTNTEQCPFSAR